MPTIDDEPIAPIQVHQLPGDSVLVIGGDRSLSVFGPDGGLARRSPTGRSRRRIGGRSAPDGAVRRRHASVPGQPPRRPRGHRNRTSALSRLFRYASDGQLLEPYGDFEDQALLFADRGAWIFGPSAQHAIADSTIWYGTAERFEIREIGREGGGDACFPARPARGHGKARATSSTYSSAASREMSGQMTAIDSTLQASVFADTFPAYDRILVDDQDNVWVRNLPVVRHRFGLRLDRLRSYGSLPRSSAGSRPCSRSTRSVRTSCSGGWPPTPAARPSTSTG